MRVPMRNRRPYCAANLCLQLRFTHRSLWLRVFPNATLLSPRLFVLASTSGAGHAKIRGIDERNCLMRARIANGTSAVKLQIADLAECTNCRQARTPKPHATMIYRMQRILFYDESQPYGWCSNFSSTPFLLDGQLWPTSEHYYQAMKYVGTSYVGIIRQAHSPMVAKMLTRDPQHLPREDWDAVKDRVMLDAVRAKFSQYANLRTLLLATEDAELVEHTENDSYWGDGGDGSGRNQLGRTLMQVRAELRAL